MIRKIFLVCLVAGWSNLAVAQEISAGSDYSAVNFYALAGASSDVGFRWSGGFHFHMQPTYPISVGTVIGNSSYSRRIGDATVGIKGVDITHVIGYWSNVEKYKESPFGWHVYGGVGISALKTDNPNFIIDNEYPINQRVGIGLDWFVKYLDGARYLSLSADTIYLFRGPDPIFTRIRPTGWHKIKINPSESLSFQIGLRYWI